MHNPDSTLKPFETATRQLALASLPTISKVLPVVNSLLTSLEPSSFDPQTIQKLKDTLRSALKSRFSHIYKQKCTLLG
ncbi:unnamed protein product, partial [Didymodactylos carnosus]